MPIEADDLAAWRRLCEEATADRDEVARLLSEWNDATSHLSNMRTPDEHEAGRALRAKGWAVVPLLIAHLEADEHEWECMALLREITGASPHRLPRDAGRMDTLAGNWIAWWRGGEAARTALPALLDEVGRLRERLDESRAVISYSADCEDEATDQAHAVVAALVEALRNELTDAEEHLEAHLEMPGYGGPRDGAAQTLRHRVKRLRAALASAAQWSGEGMGNG